MWKKRVEDVSQNLNQTWDLDAIFPGGSQSKELAAFMEQLEADIAALRGQVAGAGAPQTAADVQAWSAVLERTQDLGKRMRQVSAFSSCLVAQNVKDEGAKVLSGRVRQVSAAFTSVMTLVDKQIIEMSDAAWQALLSSPQFSPVAFNLEERRTRARQKMDAEREALVNSLSVDGYHGWSALYGTIVGRIAIPFEENGKTVKLSVGQTANRMSNGDRSVRTEAFRKWEEAWAAESELCAAALNHLAGYRLNLYKHRGWESILREPCDYNRMTRETLDVMWSTIDANKAPFVAFLNRKAKLLGLEKLSWYDVDAPLSASARKVTYEEAADFIVDNFRRFSPRMADFADNAIKGRWCEVEDRPGKRAGGFCTSFPLSRESRIFMTFAGNASNVSTLAHELGHAYHQAVMNDLPQMAQGYAMNVAETASTFAEMVVADAAVKYAPTAEERLSLLEDKAGRGVTFMMNIHARFIFESRFYEERKKGLVSVERLNALMEQAQKEAYRDALSEYHPTFWASKLHFYNTGVPFYNFPYTFGYLFSAGVYARALQEGPAFEAKYVDLLRDTGRMRVEDLAARHLGVDLTKPDFWQSAIDTVVADVNEFLKVTE